MAIVQKHVQDVSHNMRSIYQKALDVLDKRMADTDYALELLKNLVKDEPGFMEAREKLRTCERRHTTNLNGFQKFVADCKALKYILKGQMVMGSDPKAAMALAEEALALNLSSPAALNMLVKAAQNAEAPFIVIEALDMLIDLNPDNETALANAAELYKQAGETRRLLSIRQKLASMHPDNLELQAALREAAALATMDEGRWGENESAAAKAAALAKKGKVAAAGGDRIIRAEEDVRQMIEQYEGQIAKGEDSIDLRRKLADLYVRDSRFEDAIEAYQWIVQKMGTLDLAIDKQIEKAHVAIGQRKLEELKAANAPEEEIKAQEKEIFDYRLQRYEDRVQLYPNDMLCRYDLAELYWEGGEVDKSLEQFQMAQRNPAKRLLAIVYLGRCFHAKGQNDMAIDQFNKALQEMPAMDRVKKNTLYYLGTTYDDVGQHEKAFDCFKQIYSSDVNFLDVSQRMDDYYKKKKAEQQKA